MAEHTLFLCTHCDAQSLKWAGRCFECGSWGTLKEHLAENNISKKTLSTKSGETISFADIEGKEVPRIKTDIAECDQVLGGGIVPGSLILLGGEPGIGKSTLLLHVAANLAVTKNNTEKILYCSGEESAHQIKLRFDRLHKPKNLQTQSILFLPQTHCETICATIAQEKPLLAIVDSIQTISSSQLQSEAGNIAQVRACTVQLLACAKNHEIPIIITGHVTKEGQVAGPKTLEHLVDTVLYLEGDQQNYFRLLKTVKNRFGSTNEVGIFEMADDGLREVQNPSQIFLSDSFDSAPGTVTTALLEGSRAFLIHVQALTNKTYFGYPQRRAVGFDLNRLQLLVAVLSKRLGVNLGDQDIHINSVGGLKISEPAADLAVCASILSSYSNKPLPPRTLIIGEVGLQGEVRPVAQLEKRLKEAEKLGFETAILPVSKNLKTKMKIIQIKNLKELEL